MAMTRAAATAFDRRSCFKNSEDSTAPVRFLTYAITLSISGLGWKHPDSRGIGLRVFDPQSLRPLRLGQRERRRWS